MTEKILIIVTADRYAALTAAFDAPPSPNRKLRRTMQEPAPWDCTASNK